MEIELKTVAKPSPAAPSLPPTPLAKLPPPTAEELAARAKDMNIAMGWEAPTPEPAPAPVVPPVAAPPPPVVPAPAPAAVPEPLPLTTEQIIQRTAESTARLMQPAPAAVVPPAQPAFEMLPEDAEDHRVLVWLALNDPAFKGKDVQYVDYIKRLYAYQDKWLADNPEKPFETEAEEHQAWHTANPAPVTAKEVNDGRIEMKATLAAERMYNERIKPEKDAQAADAAFEAGLPQLRHNVNSRIVALVDGAMPELGKLLKDAEGRPNLNPESIALVAAADPIAHEILDELSKTDLVPMMVELEKTAITGLNYALNPSKNAIHAEIDGYRARAEADLKALPADEQIRNGRQWVPISKINSLRRAIDDGPGTKQEKDEKHAELNRSYWSLTIDDLEDLITAEVTTVAKAKIERRDATARKKYGTTAAPAAAAPQPEAQPAAQPAPSVLTRNKPPSFSSGADVVTPGKGVSAPVKSWGEEAAAVHFK